MKARKALKSRHYIAKKLITLRTQVIEKDKQIKNLKERIDLFKAGEQEAINQLIELKKRIGKLYFQEKKKKNRKK